MKKRSSRDIILQRLDSVKTFDWHTQDVYASRFHDPFKRGDNSINHFKLALEKAGGRMVVVSGAEGIIHQLQKWHIEKGWIKVKCTDATIRKQVHLTNIKMCKNSDSEIQFTSCEFLVSSTGSVLVSSHSGPGRKVFVSPRTQVVFATLSQLKHTIKEALEALQQKYEEMPSWVGLITGPSRTADIEKTLVMGAHGPNEFIVLIDDKL